MKRPRKVSRSTPAPPAPPPPAALSAAPASTGSGFDRAVDDDLVLEDDPRAVGALLGAIARTPLQPERPRIPRPSVGRIVLWCEVESAPNFAAVEWPAIVLLVDPRDARLVQVRTLAKDQIIMAMHAPTSDEPRRGCWRWPPRVDGTIEI